jgi:nitrous oxidase accessory protein
MKRKWLTIGIILLFVETCIIPAIAQNTEKPLPTSRGNWLYVGGSGPGNYSSIREALLYANNGDTIFVYHGHYFDPTNINKSITLLGEYKRTTLLEQHNSYILFVSADNVTISNFTIEGATGYYWNSGAIYVFSNNNVLTNLEFFENSGNAIFLKSSHGNVISKNVFQRNHYAITLWTVNA